MRYEHWRVSMSGKVVEKKEQPNCKNMIQGYFMTRPHSDL